MNMSFKPEKLVDRLPNRIPEGVVMDDEESARAYANADFSVPNSKFIELMTDRLNLDTTEMYALADIGAGPADIPLRFANAFPNSYAIAQDISPIMIQIAKEKISEAASNGFIKDGHVSTHLSNLEQQTLPDIRFDILVSNSVLHHTDESGGSKQFWEFLRERSHEDTKIFVGDLRRPYSAKKAWGIVNQYSDDSDEDRHLQDFYNSLRAAFRKDEIEAELKELGMDNLTVEEVGDRHVYVYGRI